MNLDDDPGEDHGPDLNLGVDLGENLGAGFDADVDVGLDVDLGPERKVGKDGVDFQRGNVSSEASLDGSFEVSLDESSDLGMEVKVDLGEDRIKVLLLDDVGHETAGADIINDSDNRRLQSDSEVNLGQSSDLGRNMELSIGPELGLNISLGPDGGLTLKVDLGLEESSSNLGMGCNIDADISAGLEGDLRAGLDRGIELDISDDRGSSLDIGRSFNWSGVDRVEEGGNCQDGRDEGGELHGKGERGEKVGGKCCCSCGGVLWKL
ncbi:MAG: hypothetical protein J3Q66DRAFT_342848 [Benniella sp.]|nr:MAG: hypothetical protein J3Q66DRAFT_342848 [Benniella sp.]